MQRERSISLPCVPNEISRAGSHEVELARHADRRRMSMEMSRKGGPQPLQSSLDLLDDETEMMDFMRNQLSARSSGSWADGDDQGKQWEGSRSCLRLPEEGGSLRSISELRKLNVEGCDSGSDILL
mmetsp:Transcript_27714/g.54163  ORF Transcript_27714/g.54163 Transcript_27714/m.54163 type:complete len:126 (+) Transcript_27714:80-457(+)